MTTSGGDGWPLVDFLRRLREDQLSGRTRPLREHLAAYPDHEREIAAEYAALHALEEHSEQATSEPRRLGRFLLQEALGTGGEGRVFLAYDTVLTRQVALKVRHTRTLSELDEARLVRAAAMAARLDHPALCRVYDTGRDDQVAWVALQYVPGISLAQQLAAWRHQRQPMQVRAAAALLAPLARGLEHAHGRRVAHRDVKPGNIMLREDGTAMLTDFGLARDLAGGDGRDLTRTGERRGTPGYMPPERLLDPHPDEAALVDADLWALAVVLFECVTLQHPFAAATEAGIVQAIRERAVWSHPAFTRLPADSRAVLATALAPDPRQRYRSAADLADDLERLGRGEPVAARRPGPLRRLGAFARREPALATATALATLALLTGAAVSSIFWHREWQARQLADARTERAHELSTSILFEMDGVLAAGGGYTDLRLAMVTRAKDAIAAQLAETPDDRALQRELLLAWTQLGDVHGHDSGSHAGDTDAADRCYGTAESLARALQGEHPRAAADLCAVLVKRADIAWKRQSTDAAASGYRAALAAAPAAANRLRAICLAQLAQIARSRGQLDAARRDIAAAEDELQSAAPSNPQHRFDLALTRGTRATILVECGEPDAAVALLDRSLDALGPPATDSRSSHHAIVWYGLLLRRAQCCMVLDDSDRALRDFAAVAAAWRLRVQADTADAGAAQRLVAVLEERGRAFAALGRRGDAERDWHEALDLAHSHGLAAAATRLDDHLRRGM